MNLAQQMRKYSVPIIVACSIWICWLFHAYSTGPYVSTTKALSDSIPLILLFVALISLMHDPANAGTKGRRPDQDAVENGQRPGISNPPTTSGFGSGIVALVGGAVAIPLGWALVVNVNDGTVSLGSALSDVLLLTCGAALAVGGVLSLMAGAFMTAKLLIGRKK